MSSKVLILLSTYNGEKYLDCQLDSLLKQTVPCDCLIRDDGSKDNTIAILDKYQTSNGRFKVIKGHNVGVIRSFSILLEMAEKLPYDYFAFCDQDDYWHPDKIEKALNVIPNGNDSPFLYASNLRLVDENLVPFGVMRSIRPPYTKKNALVVNEATGCTTVFNRKMVELYLKGKDGKMEMHDYWMFLIAVFLGQFFYDETITIDYRQHGNNAVGAHKKSFLRTMESIIHNHGSKRLSMIGSFCDIYSDYLTPEDYHLLQYFLASKNSFKHRFHLFVNRNYYSNSLSSTLGFKIRILFNRLN